MQVTYLECQVCLLIFFKERLNYWGVKKKQKQKQRLNYLCYKNLKILPHFHSPAFFFFSSSPILLFLHLLPHFLFLNLSCSNTGLYFYLQIWIDFFLLIQTRHFKNQHTSPNNQHIFKFIQSHIFFHHRGFQSQISYYIRVKSVCKLNQKIQNTLIKFPPTNFLIAPNSGDQQKRSLGN